MVGIVRMVSAWKTPGAPHGTNDGWLGREPVAMTMTFALMSRGGPASPSAGAMVRR